MQTHPSDFVDIIELWRIVREAERKPGSEQLPAVMNALQTLARTVDPKIVRTQREDLSVYYPSLTQLDLDGEPSYGELPPSRFDTSDPLA
jgi:hypothetical protein